MREDFTTQVFFESLNKSINNNVKSMSDIERLKDYFQSEEMVKLYSEVVNLISEKAVKTIEETMYQKVFERRVTTNEFLAQQELKWGKLFVASEALYICILESSDIYVDYIKGHMDELDGNDIPLFNAVNVIHARACQQYLEILTLNRNGFADGAYARWRSLYELSIISSFIRTYGNKVATAFINAANTEDRYEWARSADCFSNYPKNKFLTFAAIQKQSNKIPKEWRTEYDFANKLVHASPQGTLYRLGDKERTGNLSAGHSDYGISISSIHSAISLSVITADLFTIFQHGDSLVAMLAFHKWIKKIEECCIETEKTYFGNDSVLFEK